jgi:hypothetical protein
MTRGLLAPRLCGLFLMAATGMLSCSARAQTPGMPSAKIPNTDTGGGGAAPIPALPGSHATDDAVAPPERPPSELPPTEALFDAINRGDVAGTRDAISRGADLNGHDILGLTPMALSIDLGRNNITFLLLSLRASEESDGPPVAIAQREPAGKEGLAKQASGKAGTGHSASTHAALPPPERAPDTRLADGGVAVPTAGFLGFIPLFR